jgi:hypothetical protein
MLKFVYSFFLGLLLVVFVGMGVATFYPAPKAPDTTLGYSTPLTYDPEHNPEDAKVQAKFQKQTEQEWQSYQKKLENYNRNVAMIVLGAAVVMSVLGLALEQRVGVLAGGLLLGGVFTLLYSIGRSFAGQDPRYSFIVVSAGLAITVVVGYLKFIKPQAHATKKK